MTDASGTQQLDGEWINPFSVTTTNSAVSVFPSGNDNSEGDFHFVFTILPGDANLDNDVDGADFFIYQANIGGPGRTFEHFDFNGDGFTDAVDLALWQANYGSLLDLAIADFNADGVVELDDYFIWLDNNGIGDEHSEGDADHDGDVDMDDYQLMANQFELELVWVA